MKLKLQKLIISLMLALTLVVSSPLTALAQEVPSPTPEAEPSQQATEAQPAQEAQTSEQAQPAQEAQTAEQAAQAEEAQPAASPSPSPSPSPEITGNHGTGTSQGDDDDDGNWHDDEASYSGQHNSGQVGTDPSITTGDATAGGVVVTSANGTSVATDPQAGSACSICPAGNTTVTNTGNGDGSNNNSSANSSSNISTNVDNNAAVNNDVTFKADSGDNSASYNVGGDSQVTTGDANVSGTVITSANETGLGVAEFNVVDNHIGDIILIVPTGLFSSCGTCPSGDLTVANSDNGASSTNNAAANLTNNNQTTIANDADVINNLNFIANSGTNNTSSNVGGDSTITTGDANVAANLINAVNTTLLGGAVFVVNIFGDLVGDIIFPDSIGTTAGANTTVANTSNGANSTNNATLNSTNNNQTNIANNANVENYLTIDAETGDNSTSFNVGGNNLIDTGQVDVNAEVLNVANVNLTGSSNDPVWLILVNNMGTWTGKIIGALTGQNFAGGDNLEFTVDLNGNIRVGNSNNGDGSTNNATANLTNNNSTTVNNNANITNNMNITANTGRNNADRNVGGNSTITTGDANVAASIVNFVNTVIIGRPLMIGIINVFGSWTGNAVPPGEEPEAASAAAGAAGTQASQNSQGSSGGSSSGGDSSSSNSSSSNPNSSSSSNNGGSSQNSGIFANILGGFTGGSQSQNADDEEEYTTPLVFGTPFENGTTPVNEALLVAAIPLLLGAYFLLRRLKIKASE